MKLIDFDKIKDNLTIVYDNLDDIVPFLTEEEYKHSGVVLELVERKDNKPCVLSEKLLSSNTIHQ